MASSDQEKTTDIYLEEGQKAPFEGVLTHPDMYRYLRAEEEAANNLRVENIDLQTLYIEKPSTISPFTGFLIGVIAGGALCLAFR